MKGFLVACPDAQFSYQQLQDCKEDFTALAKQLQNNSMIRTCPHFALHQIKIQTIRIID